jgi:hypothetical protein
MSILTIIVYLYILLYFFGSNFYEASLDGAASLSPTSDLMREALAKALNIR